MSELRPLEAEFDCSGARFAIVVARWNGRITSGLLTGAEHALQKHGVNASGYDIVEVPGAFELALCAQQLARTGKYDAIITLGCVIRGGTPHFDYVCAECARGIGEVGLRENLPVAFGVLTTDDLQQALDRSADNEENKGCEAALTVLEMVTVLRKVAASE